MKGILKRLLFAALFLAVLAPAFSQGYGRGAILDPELYARVPQKAASASRDYTALPRSASLKHYAPYPGDQGQYGTCTAWASAYAARTIAESIALNRRNRAVTTDNVFSPAYIYRSISGDPECKRGTAIVHALEVMKNPGAAKRPAVERNADFKTITLPLFTASRKYPIAGYARLSMNEPSQDGKARVRAVKKALAEGKPVIIGMNCPDSFFFAKSAWKPAEDPRINYGGHAMCVVGYNDDEQGGAFEIQNSWGTDWGNGGFIWIGYDVFAAFVREAYELIEDFSQTVDFSGSVEIELSGSGGGMPVTFVPEGWYKTRGSYSSGTRFRYLMSNGDPAYVYAFASDTGETVPIFPPEGISPVLDYSRNTVAFPGERPGEIDWIELDDIPGSDYLVVLYSKQPLNIEEIRRRFENERGTFQQRTARAVGPDFISPANAGYEKETMSFSARSLNGSAVFGLLLEIEHR
ncbi:MAG: C1 family peptidase [Treponema sp.]|jgi:hypothetical protein|nr:C1 family peptidase [Treponema sp.]